MELNQSEVSDGMKWLFGAGCAAVLLVFFLIFSDRSLSTSDREQKLGQTLRELRTAQFSLGSEVSDARQGAH